MHEAKIPRSYFLLTFYVKPTVKVIVAPLHCKIAQQCAFI